MRRQLHDFLSIIHSLTHNERTELRSALASLDEYEKVCDTVELEQDTDRHCPHCNGSHIHKHGTVSGLQRYKCLSCKKTFNSLTNTPIAKLHKKEKWLSYMQCMLNSETVRKSAEKLSINSKTAFLWRHRFTEWMVSNQPKKLTGIVEVDETYYRESMKGCRKLPRKPHKRGRDNAKRGLSHQQVCVVVACDRSSQDLEAISGRGAVKAEWLDEKLTDKIAQDAVIVSDGHYAYNHFAAQANLEHMTVHNKSGQRVKGCYHIQHVNSYHSRLRQWIIGRFHGVATKYLYHYLWWRHQLEKKERISPMRLLKLSIGNPQINGT